MIRYVLGFLFRPDREKVVLIRKNRPDYMAGKLNGVGGKIEAGESALRAMIREYEEEAGVYFEGWERFAVMSGSDWGCVCFRGFGEEYGRSHTNSDEPIDTAWVNKLPDNVMPNLRWMIPFALDAKVKTIPSVVYGS